MSQRSEMPMLDSDALLFDAPLESLVPGLSRALRDVEQEHEEYDPWSVMDQPEVLARAWHATKRGRRPVRRVRHAA